MANDALYGLDQANIREQKSAGAGIKVVCPFCSGTRDGRKRMCEIIRCKKYEYALPSLLFTEQVGADRTRRGSGDEVNKNEQLKKHCTVESRREGEGGRGGAMGALGWIREPRQDFLSRVQWVQAPNEVGSRSHMVWKGVQQHD